MSNPILLEDRGVVEVAGPDATQFLQGIVTNDLTKLSPGDARFCALLTPQGKIIVDFLAFALEEGEARRYLLDCPKALEPDLLRRLTMYKLRSSVTIKSLSEELASLSVLDEARPQDPFVALTREPRAAGLGWRGLAARDRLPATGSRADYDAARIAAGVPCGGLDFAYGDTFPHEANMDRLAGIDFKKGCYVGQEVVSRMQHRTQARRRVTSFRAEGVPPPPGTPVRAGEKELGAVGSTSGKLGLALIRIDRLADAVAAGVAAEAAGTSLVFAAAQTAPPTSAQKA
jgi:folate-binding protein YgfZ